MTFITSPATATKENTNSSPISKPRQTPTPTSWAHRHAQRQKAPPPASWRASDHSLCELLNAVCDFYRLTVSTISCPKGRSSQKRPGHGTNRDPKWKPNLSYEWHLPIWAEEKELIFLPASVNESQPKHRESRVHTSRLVVTKSHLRLKVHRPCF